MNFEQARFNMVEQQVRPWEVLSQKVLDVISEIPREDFVPADKKALAYADMCIPLAHEQCMMPPVLEGRTLQELDIQPTDQVLEIGTGTAYLTVCLARLARSVVSIDIYDDFIQSAQKMLAAKDIQNVTLETADIFTMEEDTRQFDVIVVSASLEKIPQFLEHKLKIKGRMFVITGSPKQPLMQAKLVTRYGEEEFLATPLFETFMPPLQNQPVSDSFRF